MKRYRVSKHLFRRISKAENTWQFLVDWFDPAIGILHLDRIGFSKSRKRIYVFDAGINDHENSFFIEAKSN